MDKLDRLGAVCGDLGLALFKVAKAEEAQVRARPCLRAGHFARACVMCVCVCFACIARVCECVCGLKRRLRR